MDIMFEEKLSKLGMETSKTTNTNFSKREVHDDPRDKNIIIHGIDENDEKGYDGNYLKKLFSVMEMGHTSPTLAHRLGTKKPDGPRPMKLTMKSNEDKEKCLILGH